MSKKNKNSFNKWLPFVNIPFQMGITIYLFFYLGRWLNEVYFESKIDFAKVLGLIGVFISIYLVIKEVNKLNK